MHQSLDRLEENQMRTSSVMYEYHVLLSYYLNLTELNVHSELCGSHTNGGQHHRDEGTGGCKDPGEKSSS